MDLQEHGHVGNFVVREQLGDELQYHLDSSDGSYLLTVVSPIATNARAPAASAGDGHNDHDHDGGGRAPDTATTETRIQSYVLSTDTLGWRLLGGDGPRWPTIIALVEAHTSTARAPIGHTLDGSADFLSVFSALARRSTSRRRRGLPADRLDSIRSTASEASELGEDALADLWSAVEAKSEVPADEDTVAPALLGERLEVLDTAVNLRQKLRQNSLMMARNEAAQKARERANDPFWRDKHEAQLRDESFRKRFAKEQAEREKREATALQAERTRRAELELKQEQRKVKTAKRLSAALGMGLASPERLAGAPKAALAAALRNELALEDARVAELQRKLDALQPTAGQVPNPDYDTDSTPTASRQGSTHSALTRNRMGGSTTSSFGGFDRSGSTYDGFDRTRMGSTTSGFGVHDTFDVVGDDASVEADASTGAGREAVHLDGPDEFGF